MGGGHNIKLFVVGFVSEAHLLFCITLFLSQFIVLSNIGSYTDRLEQVELELEVINNTTYLIYSIVLNTFLMILVFYYFLSCNHSYYL